MNQGIVQLTMKYTFQALSLIMVVLTLADKASAKSWQQAINDVYTLAEVYSAEAERKSGQRLPQLIGNDDTRDTNMHKCAILGRRMGLTDYIRHLEPPQPPLDSSAFVLADNALSLFNWTHSAEWFAGVSQHERVKHWNLECVGNIGIPKSLWKTVPDEVFYRADGSYLWVYGDIVQGFSSRLNEALADNPGVETIAIGSAGGSVVEAMQAGLLVRQLGLSTQLSGDCVSACPLFFLGGEVRKVMRPYPRFGFHKASISGVPLPENDEIYQMVWSYVQLMDADPDLFLSEMLNWEPDEMGYVTPDRACQLGVATWYQGIGATLC